MINHAICAHLHQEQRLAAAVGRDLSTLRLPQVVASLQPVAHQQAAHHAGRLGAAGGRAGGGGAPVVLCAGSSGGGGGAWAGSVALPRYAAIMSQTTLPRPWLSSKARKARLQVPPECSPTCKEFFDMRQPPSLMFSSAQ